MLEETAGRYGFALELARRAGRRAKVFFQNRAGLCVRTKGVQDTVSQADEEVERFIRTEINRRFPSDGFLGEETGARLLTDGGPIWVVDPIDGTACFLAGIPTWCVSIALVESGEVVAGVVYDPNADELFGACSPAGATVNGEPIEVAHAETFADGMFGVGHSHRVAPDPTVDFIRGLLRSNGMYHRCGSGALTLAYVAAGRLIGYYEPHMNAWDHLGGVMLVRGAGGNTNNVLANQGLTRGAPVLAAPPALFPQVKKLVDEVQAGVVDV